MKRSPRRFADTHRTVTGTIPDATGHASAEKADGASRVRRPVALLVDRRDRRGSSPRTQARRSPGRFWRRSRPKVRFAVGRARRGVATWSSTSAGVPVAGLVVRRTAVRPLARLRRTTSISTGRSAGVACSATPTESSPWRDGQPIPAADHPGHAIGCERCHGPGELHVIGSNWSTAATRRSSTPIISSPRSGWPFAYQCEVGGPTNAVTALGGNCSTIARGSPPPHSSPSALRRRTADEVVGHVEQMKVSRCYRESQGRWVALGHDPDGRPAPEEKTGVPPPVPRLLHRTKGSKLAEPTRRARSRDDDFVQGHMPRSGRPPSPTSRPGGRRIIRWRDRRRSAPADLRGLPPGPAVQRRRPGPRGARVARPGAGDRPGIRSGMPETPQVAWVGSFVLRMLNDRGPGGPSRARPGRPPDEGHGAGARGQHYDAIQQVEMVLQGRRRREGPRRVSSPARVNWGDVRPYRPHARKAVELNPWSARSSRSSSPLLGAGEGAPKSRSTIRQGSALNRPSDPRSLIDTLLSPERRGCRSRGVHAGLIGLNPTLRESLERWFADQ